MFAVILVTGFHAFAAAAISALAGAAAGYAFRGKIHGGIVAAGNEASKAAAGVAGAASDVSKKV